MSKLTLERPLAFFDIESTGISPRADRIIDLAVTRLMPDGERSNKVWRVNPCIPIPSETTAIHGITDADVAHCPTFPDIAPEVRAFLEGCDLAGYNVLRFDIPILAEEFLRTGMDFDLDNRRVVDVQRIFHRKEPRDLTAALAYYCNEMHLDAHGAQSDVKATIRIFEAQLARYEDLPGDVEKLSEYCDTRNPDWVDRQGRLKWVNGEVTLNFGRKKGTPLREIVDQDPGFIKWLLRSDFPPDTRDIVAAAAEGRWPKPPETS